MSRFIIAIIVALTISNVIAKEFWQCDLAGKYTCATTQTCCRNKISQTGWACFPTTRGVCCSDGVSVCPEQTICNLRERRCDKATALTFLGEETSTDAAFYEATMTEVTSVPADFAEGFLEGIQVFSGLAHADQCKPTDDAIAQELIEIANILSNITITSDFKTIIPQILAKVTDLYTRLAKVSDECSAYVAEIQKVMTALQEYATVSGYSWKLGLHTAGNIVEITTRVTQATQALNNNQYLEAGKSFGGLVKFVFFWDFQAQLSVFLSEVVAFNPQDATQFVIGLNDGLTFLKDLPHQNDCKYDQVALAQDVMTIITFVKNNVYTPEVIQQAFNAAFDIYKRLGTISEVCNAYAMEMSEVIGKLYDYVAAPEYFTSLSAHTNANVLPITVRATTALAYLQAATPNYQQAGQSVGDLIRFVLFWDFHRN